MKTKLLVIDDETEYLNDVSRGLEIMGYEVSKASNGRDAIAILGSAKPDAILCDYKLEDMDGTRIIAEAKAARPGTICLMVTAYYDESFNDIFKKAGADEIVYKPIQLIELDNLIKKLLKKGGRS